MSVHPRPQPHALSRLARAPPLVTAPSTASTIKTATTPPSVAAAGTSQRATSPQTVSVETQVTAATSTGTLAKTPLLASSTTTYQEVRRAIYRVHNGAI